MNAAPYFIVLTCDPAHPSLNDALVEAVRKTVNGAPATSLAQHIAYEIACDGSANVTTIRALLGEQAIDANLVSAADRRKKLLIADMESTIIEQECLDELADLLDLRPKIADITDRAMRGELDFERALNERVMLLKGLPEATLQQIYDERVTLMPGAQTLIKTMNKHGAMCGLVSGGFSFYAEKIAERLGFDRWRSNLLNISNGALDGTVDTPILGRKAKAEFLAAWTNELDLTPAQTLAVGDGSNDLAMLGDAGFGVAFRAKPLVRDAANINITHGDLTGLLYLQGYRQEDFA